MLTNATAEIRWSTHADTNNLTTPPPKLETERGFQPGRLPERGRWSQRSADHRVANGNDSKTLEGS